MMDEICEDQGAYHSKDMVSIDYGSGPVVVLCGYHELRRLMRVGAVRSARVVVLSGRE